MRRFPCVIEVLYASLREAKSSESRLCLFPADRNGPVLLLLAMTRQKTREVSDEWCCDGDNQELNRLSSCKIVVYQSVCARTTASVCEPFSLFQKSEAKVLSPGQAKATSKAMAKIAKRGGRPIQDSA
jgi:hypothetical protein